MLIVIIEMLSPLELLIIIVIIIEIGYGLHDKNMNEMLGKLPNKFE